MQLTSLSLALTRAGFLSFSPASLFAASEQGVWYEPSLTNGTCFQDSSGTTPVTAVEQPVGLMLDKSKGLVLGPELVTNGDFSNGNTGWTQISGTFTFSNGRAIAANFDSIKRLSSTASSMVAGRWYVITWNQYAGAGTGAANWTLPGVWNGNDNFANGGTYINGEGQKTLYYLAPVSGQFYLYNFEQAVEYDNISVRELPGNHATQTTSTSRPVLSARVNLLTATATLATQTVVTRATTQTLRFTGAGTVTLSGTATGTFSAGTHSVTTTAGNLTLTVSGTVTEADLRASNMGVGLPAYQAVVNSTTYDTTGFPLYLKFDGVDDFLVTNSINFTATDKMTVFAGVRKLSDAAGAVLVELSATVASNKGSFYITAPESILATGNYGALSCGSINSGSAALAKSATILAPVTSVISSSHDIPGDLTSIRVNGAASGTNATGDQGTGNYGNYPLYIGRRGGTTLPFNGHLYSLIVRGAQSNTGQIASAETWVNSKTGAY